MAAIGKPWRRRFPPTRGGWWFLGATLVIGLGAVNGGINLMFLIFGMMLSLIIASGVMSELGLRGLEVTRRPPPAVYAGTPFLMGIAVKNVKRRAPTFSLEVEDMVGDRPAERRCYFLKLPAGRTQETAYRHALARRGVYAFSGFRLSTRFPFGFIRKSRDVAAPLDVLVYPALIPIQNPLVRRGLADGQRQAPRRRRAGEFHGLREFRTGDDPRDIHWRTSARRGRPFVREFEEESGRTAVIVLEGARDGAHDGEQGQPFEHAVSLAASLAAVLTRDGYHVGLLAGRTYLAPAGSPGHLASMLRCLALIEPHAPPDAGHAAVRAAHAHTTLVVAPGEPLPRVQAPRLAAGQLRAGG